MRIVPKDNVYDFQDLVCLVGEPIYIKYWDRVENTLSVDSLGIDKVLVNEATSCSTV